MGDVIAFPRQRDTTASQRGEPASAVERVVGTSRQAGASPGAVEHRRLLWREAVGHELRRERQTQERTQGDVADAAGISTQYLSEVERGRKEPSSEILEAAAGALGLDVGRLARRAADQISLHELANASTVDAPIPTRPDGPVLLAA